MNTYAKYCPNVFVAKCSEKHESGETILLETKYGNKHECIVYNLVKGGSDGFFYYSIVRADGFNSQEWAKRKADKLGLNALSAENKSNLYYEKSNKDRGFLSLGEPIKIGHHLEKRHRKAFEDANNNMRKCVEFSKKAEEYESRVSYWEKKASSINLSMPESLEFYQFELEKAIQEHLDLKSGAKKPAHSYSITYANKKVKDLKSKIEIAKKLWS